MQKTTEALHLLPASARDGHGFPGDFSNPRARFFNHPVCVSQYRRAFFDQHSNLIGQGANSFNRGTNLGDDWADLIQHRPHLRNHRPSLAHFVTFTEYEKGLTAEVAFPDEPLNEVLAAVVADAGWRQFHTAETEKYAHVTYFLNGGREAPFPGEERLLVPSPRVATYDLKPEMSAQPVTDALLDRLAGGDDRLLVVNFANPDMVGHTGVFPATVRAVEVVDAMLGRIAGPVLSRRGILAITADHGNAELKVDRATGAPLTAHTTSPVPLILAGTDDVHGLREGGKLGDIAPTLLPLVGLEVPRAMSGDDLRASTRPSPTPSG